VRGVLRQRRSSRPKLQPQINAGIAKLEKQTLGKKFGDLEVPLLVAVRSGARESMPGMMDTILNLGLNDETVEALKAATGNRASPGTATVASCRCTATW
jgi:pyruvate,orthophosphate dikinase